MNPMLLLIGGGAALYFLSAKPKVRATPALQIPAGYTPVGSGLYRDAAGSLYARNPSTGTMVRAPSGSQPTSADDVLTRLGISLIPTVGQAAAGAVPGFLDWASGLFSGSGSATTPNEASLPVVDTIPGYVEAEPDPWAAYDWNSYFAAQDFGVPYVEPLPDYDFAAYDYGVPDPTVAVEPFPIVTEYPSYEYEGFYGYAGRRYTGIY
jgi:hypothetical protein